MGEPRNVFVPNGESRYETAVLLVGTADEHGIRQQDVQASNGGFFITEELADLVYEGQVPEEPEPVDTSDVEPLGDPESSEEPNLPPYDEWDYGDLKSEVATRELDVADQKKDTLVAALVADDEETAE